MSNEENYFYFACKYRTLIVIKTDLDGNLSKIKTLNFEASKKLEDLGKQFLKENERKQGAEEVLLLNGQPCQSS